MIRPYVKSLALLCSIWLQRMKKIVFVPVFVLGCPVLVVQAWFHTSVTTLPLFWGLPSGGEIQELPIGPYYQVGHFSEPCHGEFALQ